MSVTCAVTGETFLGWFDPSGSKITTSQSANMRVKSSLTDHTLKFVDVKVSFGSDKYECRGRNNKKTFKLNVACKYEVYIYLYNNLFIIQDLLHIPIKAFEY